MEPYIAIQRLNARQHLITFDSIASDCVILWKSFLIYPVTAIQNYKFLAKSIPLCYKIIAGNFGDVGT